MVNLIKIKASAVQFYGAHRTLAMAHLKMPAPFGDLKLSENYMKKAYTDTLGPTGILLSGNIPFYGKNAQRSKEVSFH